MPTQAIQWIPISVIANLLGLLLMIFDKQAARKHQRRVPELLFFFISCFGGWIGIIVGGLLVRHKTKKRSFQLKIVCGIIISIYILQSL